MRHTLQMKLLIFGVICFSLTVGCSTVQILQFRQIGQRQFALTQRIVRLASGDTNEPGQNA